MSRAVEVAIARGDHDDVVLLRARALGWRPNPHAELDELARRARADLENMLSEVSETPLPFDTTDEPRK